MTAAVQPPVHVPGASRLGRTAERVLCELRVPPITTGSMEDAHARASEVFTSLVSSLAGSSCVIWADNYVRPIILVDPV